MLSDNHMRRLLVIRMIAQKRGDLSKEELKPNLGFEFLDSPPYAILVPLPTCKANMPVNLFF